MTIESKLKICVVRGLLDSVSMIWYADQLIENIHHYAPNISVAEVSPSLPTWLRERAQIEKVAAFVYRYLFYPWRIRNLKADIFHITNHSHAHLIASLDARRTVITCHDLTGIVHPENIRGSAQLPLVSESAYRFSVGFLKRAARIVVDSENTKRDVLRLLQCQDRQVQVVHLGLAPFFQVRSNELAIQAFKRDHGMENGLLMLHVGSNLPYKNIPAIFETLDILNHKLGLEVKLVKVGPPFTDEQEHLIHERGLNNQIIHLGHLQSPELVLTYQSCDVMLFPSLYEGFGVPPLEAMACGLPVVASNAGSLPEVLDDAALLISPNDHAAMARAVVTVFSNSQLRQELIGKGLAHARQFTREKSIMELVSIYRQVMIEALSVPGKKQWIDNESSS